MKQILIGLTLAMASGAWASVSFEGTWTSKCESARDFPNAESAYMHIVNEQRVGRYHTEIKFFLDDQCTQPWDPGYEVFDSGRYVVGGSFGEGFALDLISDDDNIAPTYTIYRVEESSTDTLFMGSSANKPDQRPQQVLREYPYYRTAL